MRGPNLNRRPSGYEGYTETKTAKICPDASKTGHLGIDFSDKILRVSHLAKFNQMRVGANWDTQFAKRVVDPLRDIPLGVSLH